MDTIRIIRVDCSSRSCTPRPPALSLEIPEETILWDYARREEDRPLPFDTDSSRHRAEARRLEDKVAKVAAKKCSVEEVHTLQKELQEWLMTDAQSKVDSQVSMILGRVTQPPLTTPLP